VLMLKYACRGCLCKQQPRRRQGPALHIYCACKQRQTAVLHLQSLCAGYIKSLETSPCSGLGEPHYLPIICSAAPHVCLCRDSTAGRVQTPSGHPPGQTSHSSSSSSSKWDLRAAERKSCIRHGACCHMWRIVACYRASSCV
jgi:hypothetical protein